MRGCKLPKQGNEFSILSIKTLKQGNEFSIPFIKELHASWGRKVVLKQRRGLENLVKRANWPSKLKLGFEKRVA